MYTGKTLKCNHSGCKEQVVPPDNKRLTASATASAKGWQCLSAKEHYCPDHRKSKAKEAKSKGTSAKKATKSRDTKALTAKRLTAKHAAKPAKPTGGTPIPGAVKAVLKKVIASASPASSTDPAS